MSTPVVDLTGPIITALLADPNVTAITPRIRGGELAPGDTAPAVVVVQLTNTRSPFGPGKGRLGMQRPRFALNCFAMTYPQAAQLAGAVSGALHNLRPGKLGGATPKTIHLVTDEGWGGPVLDPKTNWPTETVVVDVTGAA